MIGKRGVVIETLQPSGKIIVEGEIWNATSRDRTIIEKGRQVKVVGINGMTLIVEEEKS
jgi:membrane-bound serine protease (ClpP class)